MVRKGHITVPLSEQDRLEIEIEKEGGRVTGFVINYVATVAGQDHSVVRFDTCHGFPHKDEMYRDGGLRRKERLPELNGHQLVDLAIDDIKTNWKIYRRRFER